MEVTLRAAAVFVLLWVAIRVSGKREVSQMSAFELILLVTLGDLVAQAVLQEDYSLVGATVTVGVFTMLSVLLSWMSWRFPKTRNALESTPTILLRDGVPDETALRAERMPMDDLLEAAREHGVRDLADVDLVVLETDGRFSFFTRDRSPGDEGEGGHKVTG